MNTGQIDAGSLFGTSARRLPAESVGNERSDAQRTDGNAVKRDEVSLTRRSLSILSREIRQVLSSEFNFRLKAAAGYGEEASVRGRIATDVKAAGKALLAASPLSARDQLGALRQSVQEAAEQTRNVAGSSDSDIDGALGQIEDGLDELDSEASRNVTSSASVLSYESRLRQRSVINIRTQEGDVVKLDLRRMESIEASDVSLSNGSASFTATEIDISSRSRMFLKVKGDINEGEMAAIQAVVSQAAAAADEFYGGDMAAAFDGLAGMEFDTDQLSRVKVRFRERLETNVSFASIQRFEPAPVAAPAPAVDPRLETPDSESAPIDVVNPEPRRPEPAPFKLGVLPAGTPERVEVAPGASEPAAPTVDPIKGLSDLLADFINRTNDGFELEGGTYRYYYSESFKLQLLKSVMQVAAPDETGSAAEVAANAIDAVNETADSD